MTKRITTKAIIKAIGCDNLTLVRDVGYWYFVYDDVKFLFYKTESVYTPRLNDLSLDRWVDIGKAFVTEIQQQEK